MRDRQGGVLSGGEQQMLTIARTLMGNPRAAAARRAVGGAGAAGRRDAARAVGELKAAGLTILLAEQNCSSLMALADRVYILEKGEVRFTGTMQQLAADPDLRRTHLGVLDGTRLRSPSPQEYDPNLNRERQRLAR